MCGIAGVLDLAGLRMVPEGYPNLTVKKIPKAVLARCEWGHDDYSLKMENLPKAPPKPGELFAEAELAAPVEKRKP